MTTLVIFWGRFTIIDLCGQSHWDHGEKALLVSDVMIAEDSVSSRVHSSTTDQRRVGE